MKANLEGIKWVRTQPELIKKMENWWRVVGTQPKELYYYNRVCPMTGGRRPPIGLSPKDRCRICKAIWPDIVKHDFLCPCYTIEISIEEILYVATLILKE